MDVHDTIASTWSPWWWTNLVVCGAEPVLLQDYIAIGKVVPEKVAAIVKGIAEGCVQAGCALLGGETAEHPGLMSDGAYERVGHRRRRGRGRQDPRPERVRDGDVVIAMGSTGLHSNVTRWPGTCCWTSARMPLEGHVEEFGRTLGEELLSRPGSTPRTALALAAEADVRTFAHITGGGLVSNLARVIPDGLTATLERGTWTPAPVFALIASAAGRAGRDGERRSTWASAWSPWSRRDADRALAVLTARHVPAWVLGEIGPAAAARTVLRGDHPRF